MPVNGQLRVLSRPRGGPQHAALTAPLPQRAETLHERSRRWCFSATCAPSRHPARPAAQAASKRTQREAEVRARANGGKRGVSRAIRRVVRRTRDRGKQLGLSAPLRPPSREARAADPEAVGLPLPLPPRGAVDIFVIREREIYCGTPSGNGSCEPRAGHVPQVEGRDGAEPWKLPSTGARQCQGQRRKPLFQTARAHENLTRRTRAPRGGEKPRHPHSRPGRDQGQTPAAHALTCHPCFWSERGKSRAKIPVSHRS